MDALHQPSNLRKKALLGEFKAPGPLTSVGETTEAQGPGISAPAEHSTRRSLPAPVSWDKYWDQQLTLDLPDRKATFNVYVAGNKGPVLYCIHGGGYTGLTWSMVAARLKENYRIVAPDLRGHGLTVAEDEADFSKETLASDVVAIWKHLFGGNDKTPTMILGHSMGGAVAVWAVAQQQIPDLEGTIVIDVVEGTALAALPHMMGVINSRPSHFKSLEEGIAWCLRSGMSKNKEAAAVSFPSQLQQTDDGQWTWRTQLDKTQPFWEEWYKSLSEEFLKARTPKMLLLAGTDRLDKALTIGQMQGKFQLVLMPMAGHAIHEDEAEKTAEHLLQFAKRFRLGEPPLQFPKASGVRPVLPIVAGPVHQQP